MPLVFISYNRKDSKYAKALSDQLKARGISVFLDVDSIAPSQQFPKATAESIAKCDLLLLLWSQNSAASHFVTDEWNIALASKKAIFPVLLDECPLPAALMATNAWKWTSAARLANGVVGLVIGKERAAATTRTQEIGFLWWFLGAGMLVIAAISIWKMATMPAVEAAITDSVTDSTSAKTAVPGLLETPKKIEVDPKAERRSQKATASEQVDSADDSLIKPIVLDTTSPIKLLPENLLREPLVLKGKIYLEEPPGTGIPHVEIYVTQKNGHRVLIEPIFTNDAGNYELIIPAGNIKPDRIWVDGRDAGYGKKDFPLLDRTTKLDYPLEKRPR